jgi:polysaccharide biosynthesis transport protein
VIDMGDRADTATAILCGSEYAVSVPRAEQFADTDGSIRFDMFLDILRRRRRLIGWIVFCGAIMVAGMTGFLPPRYTAKAQIVITESRVPRIDGQVSSADAGPDQPTMQTQVTALSSHDLLATVIAQLGSDPAFRAIQRRGRGSIPDLSLAGKSTFAIEKLEQHLHVFQESGSHVISVAYSSRDPVEAAVIANKITGYYLAAGGDHSRLVLNQAVTAMTRKIAELGLQSDSLEGAVAAYQAANGLNDADNRNVIEEQLRDLNHQLSVAQSELVARRTRRADLLALRGAHRDWQPLLAGRDPQGLVDLHDQVVAVLAGRQNDIVVVPHSTEASPQQQPAPPSLFDKVRKELAQALLKLYGEERVADAQVAAIQNRLNAVQRASDDIRLHELVSAAVAAHHRYERLVQRRNELLEQSDDVTAPARLLSWAAVPHRPSSLNPLLFAPPALMAFLVIGCVVALLRDRLDRGIYSNVDVASALGLACAGAVPSSPGIFPHNGATSVSSAATVTFTEAVRGILVSLRLVALRRRKQQVVLITSSVPGEGKTTLARSLAASAAQTGAKVLLIGLDDRTESGLSEAPGADDALHCLLDCGTKADTRGKVDLLAGDRAPIVLMPTATGPALHYLPIRRGPAAEPSPLLSIDQMSQLFRRLRSSYDLIFVDCASVLAKAEVRLLAAMSDHVVFVVRWRKTRRDDARTALALLRDYLPGSTQTPVTISAAITQVDLERHAIGTLAAALLKTWQRLIRSPVRLS